MIKKNILTLGAFIIALSVCSINVNAQSSAAPIVVELFTSQSCASCPPADKILDELSQHSNIIALGCHVTYWDHLRWKDTLSQEFCTTRQKSYNNALNSNRIYTPQMIVNGKAAFVGSHRDELNKEISRATPIKPISITQNGANYSVNLPALSEYGDYIIWVFGYQKRKTEALRGGENRGRSVTYANAVIDLKILSSWTGQPKTYGLSKPVRGDIDGLAVIAQRTTHGDVVAAGKVEF